MSADMGALEQVLGDILTEYEARGNDVRLWPADEAKAYRDAGGFQAGNDAVLKVRIANAVARVQPVLKQAQRQGYLDGVDEAQYMTGFTDGTHKAVLDQSPYGRPVEPDEVPAEESVVVVAVADSYAGCRADRDGDCSWQECPQLRDNEPKATGRHCPRDNPERITKHERHRPSH